MNCLRGIRLREPRSQLYEYLTQVWLISPKDDFFLRVESFYNTASYLDENSTLARYGGCNNHGKVDFDYSILIVIKYLRVIVLANLKDINAFSLYPKVIMEYEKIIEPYLFEKYEINSFENVYVIQDSFIVYIGIVKYGTEYESYRVVLEDLLSNQIFKFIYSKFCRLFNQDEQRFLAYKRFYGKWGEPIFQPHKSFVTQYLSDEYIKEHTVESRCYTVCKNLPEIRLYDRFEHWTGNLYYYIIYELSDRSKTGYAIYITQNPQVHKIANEIANQVEWSALKYYGYAANRDEKKSQEDFCRYQFEKTHLSDGVNCDGNIIDLLCNKIEIHKANGWEHKYRKHVSPEKLCIAEHELKYFIIERYAKTKKESMKIGEELFRAVHNGKYQDEPRYEYIIPENKWKSEQMVYEIVKRLYKKYTVLYQHRPYFLHTDRGQMSYDIYICGLDVAIEYQGKQHFEPVEIFGGEEHFKDQVYRDRLKKELSDKNGVKLVYINYYEDISPDFIKSRIEELL